MNMDGGTLPENQVEELQRAARELRLRTIANSSKTGTPHLGSCLSCMDLLVFMYWKARAGQVIVPTVQSAGAHPSGCGPQP